MDDLTKLRRQKLLDNIKRNKFVQNLKAQLEENPVVVIVAVTGLLVAGARLINAWGHTKGSRAYARQVDYRINKLR